ncbi:MAG: FliM/FliN family flagellar motor switch protein [Verrucomicrobiota bacterium]
MNPSPTLTDMEPAPSVSGSKEIISQSEIERLITQVESVAPAAPGAEPQAGANPAVRELVRRLEFPKLSPFSAAELRPLRMRHEDFVNALATRLSIHLGLEAILHLSKLEAQPFHQFIDGLASPTYLTMLKLQPLTGICLLDIPPKLGLCIVDRELGGPGRVTEETRPIGKIEERLLGPVVGLIVNEWCGIWNDLMEIQPVVLGNESNGRFLHTSTEGNSMLVVGVEARLGETTEQIQFAFPHPMLEPLTLKLNTGAGSGGKPDAAAKAAPAKWNSLFDDVQIELKAELPELQLPAGQVAELKPGDVLNFPAEFMNEVRLRLAHHPGFVGTLGTSNRRRAVKIDKCLKS